jgi:predicted CXXCH cytochrome family protein
MIRTRLSALAWLAPALVVALPGTATSARAEGSCVTAECHASLLARRHVHPATQSCGDCHEETATPHPQAGKKTFRLAAQPPELCFNCHDAFGTKASVHEPVAGGECTTCHDPHASDQAKLLTQPVGELCTSCHDGPSAAPHLHGPVSSGECTACHVPHVSDIKPLLAKAPPQLCFDCHGDLEAELKKKTVHAALDDGCTSCHSPHGSANAKLLAQPVPELCFQCHDDVAETVQKAAVAHPAVTSEKACASCHSPHASDQDKLLLAPEKETCLACHAGIVTRAMTTLHGPIAEGRCTPCHEPHGGANPKLLVAPFPEQPYVAYTDDAFPLCFTCHNRDLLAYPQTSFATGFRDGERNLHYLHVHNAQKGRSCRLCHDLHGGTNPVLVAASVPFGKWALPIQFTRTANGGSCAPGCHRPQAYDRVNPVRKSTPAAAGKAD